MKTKKGTVARILLNELYKLGVEYVFLVPGTQISPILIELFNNKDIHIPKPIIANHELASGFMAIGYARASGNPGVAISIGGPGAAYMIGAAVTAKADDVPVLFITGNIPENALGKGEFQDAGADGSNDCFIYNKAMGKSFVINQEEDISTLFKLFRESLDGMYPLHVQIPFNVLKTKIISGSYSANNKQKKFKLPKIENIVDRAVLVLGYKAINHIDSKKLLYFIERTKIGLITDTKTRGIVPEVNNEVIGFIGSFCSKKALKVFDNLSEIKANSIIYVGVNKHLVDRFNKNPKQNNYFIEPEGFNSWMESVEVDSEVIESNSNWLNEIQKTSINKSGLTVKSKQFRYFDLIGILKNFVPENTVYCLDSGQIRIAASIYLKSFYSRTIIQSDNLSPMGFGISASIGAQLANPGKKVVALFGDGSMRMHGMEIATSVRYHLPIIFILCDNQSYLSVKGPQDANDLSEVDWMSYVNSFGIKSYNPACKESFSQILSQVVNLDEPVFFWIKIPGLVKAELKEYDDVIINNWYSEL